MATIGKTVRKVATGLGIGLGVVVVALGVATATRPDTFRVERSATISAPAETAFALVNDFHSWAIWSPYEKLDPALQRSFSGARSGEGAIYGWRGTDKAGAGRMTIAKSDPAKLVSIKLEFIEPFECTSEATFTFTPAAGGTKVTWAIDGENTLFGKVASLFVDMDELVGKDFEAGLAALKSAAEGAPKATARAVP